MAVQTDAGDIMTFMKTVYAASEESIGDPAVASMLEQMIAGKKLKKVLLVPPDSTRAHSYAGSICQILAKVLKGVDLDVIPALGTHIKMKRDQIVRMYPGLPENRFMVHRWRKDVIRLGEIPAELVSDVSGGRIARAIPVEINKILLDKSYDLILSIGQVVPHEVAGMANFYKNIFVGLGGKTMIDMSHMLGAVSGLERIMGRDHTPIHQIFDFAAKTYLVDLPIIYILTVTTTDNGITRLRGLFIGNHREAYEKAVGLSQKLNITVIPEPLKKVVAFLPAHEFRTTWTGNKAIYRTRMALADGAELIVMGPGISGCGEDPLFDELIRKYGYGRTTEEIMRLVDDSLLLGENLAVAAHLIHSSSEGRFKITYSPGRLGADEILSLGFNYLDYARSCQKYNPRKLKYGFNDVSGEKVFFIPNPALGLWTTRQKINENMGR